MEDLWGSPWASDLPSAHAKLDDFPAAPQTVHFGSAHQPPPHHQQYQQHSLPRKISQNLSPWHDDDAWGDVQAAPAQRWRRSPGMKTVESFASLKREVSPDPWKALDNAHFETRAAPETTTPFVAARAGEAMHHQEQKVGEKQSVKVEDMSPPAPQSSTEARSVQMVETPRDVWAIEHDTPPVATEPELIKSSSEAEESSTEESAREDEEDAEDADAGTEPHVDIKDDLADSDHTDEADPSPKFHDIRPEPLISEKDALPVPKPSMLFPIDFALLDSVFPTTGPINARPEPLPDIIIDNTFTTIGERKTWYRISRFGSRRKHDSGMDDNYIRVSWAGSQVRDRTLMTVQRWMEQEALTGRSHIGGRPGASGASLFNWDSKGPPVEIDQLLEKKAMQAKHTRHSSLVPAPTPGPEEMGWSNSTPPSPTQAKSKQRPVSMIQLASTALPNPWADSAPALKFYPALSSPLKTSPARPSNLKNVETADNEPVLVNTLSTRQKNSLRSNLDHAEAAADEKKNKIRDVSNHGNDDENDADENDEADDDDDEWGEMVGTSPPGDIGGGGGVFGPLSETARASLESFKDDIFDGESPPERPQALPDIADLPSSASTIWDVSHPEDGASPAPSPSLPLSAGGGMGGIDDGINGGGERAAPAAFPFPVTPPITPAPSTPTALPALREGISIEGANRKASLAQAIAMSSPATSVSDRDVDLERAKERGKEREKHGHGKKDKGQDEEDNDMDAVVAEILRNLPDLTYMLR